VETWYGKLSQRRGGPTTTALKRMVGFFLMSSIGEIGTASSEQNCSIPKESDHHEL